jgi:hypothetical protein
MTEAEARQLLRDGTGSARTNLVSGWAMTKAEVVILVLGLTLVGATVWVPALSDKTKVLLLLLVIAAGILVMLHRLTVP